MRTQSFSSINTYYTCSRMYDLQYNKKVIPYQETEATLYGGRVHKALEDYARDGTPPPEDCLPFTKYVDKIKSLDGTLMLEHQFALTRNMVGTDFDDKSAWIRGVIDIAVIGKDRAFAGDYTTGKIRTGSDQLKLFAGVILTLNPTIESVRTAYIWLNHDKITSESYKRSDLPEIWEHFLTKLRKIQMSYEKDKWIPNQSGLCRGYCGAGREHCEFWSPRRS